ncbi:MAG: hypothetical protein ACKVX7_13520 [Planctomycetota bacterium]
MIRNRTEYADALARLADEQARLSEDRARLSAGGLTDDDIQNFLGPLEILRQHLSEEIEAYERARVVAEQDSSSADTPRAASTQEPTTPAVSGSAAVGADGASAAPKMKKRKSRARSKVKTKALPSQTRATPTAKSKRKSIRMPRRKAMKLGPRRTKPDQDSAVRATRRKFSIDDKRRILAEIDAAPRGAKGKVVERHQLHSATIVEWRKRVAKTGAAGAGAARSKVGAPAGRPKRARVATTKDATDLVDLVRENRALRIEVAALRARMIHVQRFVAIQNQLAAELLGSE